MQTKLFSDDWLDALQSEWNRDDALISVLENANFSALIAFGLLEEQTARVCITVSEGRIVSVVNGAAVQQAVDWDLRASEQLWQEWRQTPPGLLALGMAYSTQQLKILAGDYVSMLKDPLMADSFVKSFEIMSRIQ